MNFTYYFTFCDIKLKFVGVLTKSTVRVRQFVDSLSKV